MCAGRAVACGKWVHTSIATRTKQSSARDQAERVLQGSTSHSAVLVTESRLRSGAQQDRDEDGGSQEPSSWEAIDLREKAERKKRNMLA